MKRSSRRCSLSPQRSAWPLEAKRPSLDPLLLLSLSFSSLLSFHWLVQLQTTLPLAPLYLISTLSALSHLPPALLPPSVSSSPQCLLPSLSLPGPSPSSPTTPSSRTSLTLPLTPLPPSPPPRRTANGRLRCPRGRRLRPWRVAEFRRGRGRRSRGKRWRQSRGWER